MLVYSLMINGSYTETKVKVEILRDMFVRSRGVWFGFAENMFMFCLAKFRKHVFSEDDCHPSLNLHSFTNIGWSLRLLEKTWQQLFL